MTVESLLIRRLRRTAAALCAGLSAGLLLTACQSFGVREFNLPAGKDQEVRDILAAWALDHGLRPCAEWNVQVDGADSCFGGRIESMSVTAVTRSQGDRYLVHIGVYAGGLDTSGAIKIRDDQLRTRLEAVFEPGQLIARQLPAPMQTRRITG